MFSPADYEFASRLTGLPVPRTPAEQAAAAPVVATILRNYSRAMPPAPGMEDANGIQTSPTRSLNEPPQNTQPEVRNQVERRMRAGVSNENQIAMLVELLSMIQQDPSVVDQMLMALQNSNMEGAESADRLSSQRPLMYDMPSYGGQYSILNAPSSSSVPPSIAYQPLS